MTETLRRLGHFGTFAGRATWRMLTPPWNASDVFRHAWTLVARCAGPVCATTFPFGMVIALQGLQIFDLFGAQRLLPSLISVTVLRELSPVLASVLVAAQGGSSFAAEVGAMRIKEELDATEVMAVDGIRWHIVPRLWAMIIACPILDVAGSVAGLAGGYVTAVFLRGESGGVYLANLWAFTTPFDVIGGVLKTVVFGYIIGIIANYHGYFTTGGAAGVGRAVNDTVVRSSLSFFAANYLLTSAMFPR